MDERTPPTEHTPAAPDFIRDGKQLAHDLCRELGLPAPHATDPASTAIIDGLAAARGWTVTAHVATADEWREMEVQHTRRRGDVSTGDVSTGEVRSRGPGAWEIVVIPGTTAFYRDTVALTLLAHIVRDDVPLSGRARLASGASTYEDALARVFAREVELLFLRASRSGRPPLGMPTDHATPTPWLTRIARWILRLYGVNDSDRLLKQEGPLQRFVRKWAIWSRTDAAWSRLSIAAAISPVPYCG